MRGIERYGVAHDAKPICTLPERRQDDLFQLLIKRLRLPAGTLIRIGAGSRFADRPTRDVFDADLKPPAVEGA